MPFKFDNYSVLFTNTDLYYQDAVTYNIVATDFPNIKTLGVIKSDSFYKVEPKEVIADSLGEDVIASYQLDVELNVESVVDDAKKLLIDGEMLSIVLVPKTVKIDEAASDLSATGNVIPTGSKFLVFKPGTAKVFDNIKLGNREINPLNIKLSALANTKAELIKAFNVTII